MRVRLIGCLAAGVGIMAPGCDDGYVVVRDPHAHVRSAAIPAIAAGDVEAVPLDDGARVLVTTDKNLARPTEVVGVLDFHSRADSEDKGFDELRARAAALGADAVIGAEFEHGEGTEPSHLSGMAVRFR